MEKLIHLVRAEEALWNQKSKGYLLRKQEKLKIWERVGTSPTRQVNLTSISYVDVVAPATGNETADTYNPVVEDEAEEVASESQLSTTGN